MNAKAAFPVFCLFVSWLYVSFCQQGNKSDTGMTTRIAMKERIEELLVCPVCLDSFSESSRSYIIEEVTFSSGDIKLRGELYLPKKPGPHPAIVYMHGGETITIC